MTTGTKIDAALTPILPLTAMVNDAGHLTIGGCDTTDLARQFGTPLYVFDEADLRRRCREYRAEFEALLPDVGVVYAAKAYMGKALAGLIADEGLGLDVVSAGEIALARAAEFPLERAYFSWQQQVASGAGAGAGGRCRPDRHRQFRRHRPAG